MQLSIHEGGNVYPAWCSQNFPMGHRNVTMYRCLRHNSR